MNNHIPIPEIKKYTTSIRGCKISQSCELESKQGLIEFDFSNFSNAEECLIQTKRKSGNGLVNIIQGTNITPHIITSKKSQYLNINIRDSKCFNIIRPSNSNGVIEIIGITLKGSENIVTNNWKDELGKCISYRSIRLSNDKLFAAEGAILKANSIISIDTDPPKSFIIKENTIKFVTSCEIISLKVSKDQPINKKQLYPHIVGSPQITTQHRAHTEVSKHIPTIVRHKHHEIPLTPSPSMNILYDSHNSPIAKASLSSLDAKLAANGFGIHLGRKGSISIPIASIKANQNYILICEMRKVNGNGKVIAYIEPSPNGFKPKITFATAHKKNIDFSIRSGQNVNQGQSFRLVINRPESTTGDIVVTRIILLDSLKLPNNQDLQRLIQHQIYDNNTTEPIKFHLLKDNINIIDNDSANIEGIYKMPKQDEIKFVIVIPSYKNEKWVEKNIKSALNQKYEKYRIIFIDDNSPDNTYEKAKNIIEQHANSERVKLIRNSERKGALHNLYDAIHSCDDNEIVITLDGDDWLAHDKVLNRLYDYYSNTDVWMTYGQYQSYPDNGKGCSQQIPQHIIKHNLFRQFRWCSSHLRTFYAWLFKKIKKEDFLDEHGKFIPMAWDLPIMFGCLELAGFHSRFIPDILYIYNVENPINDSKVNVKLQQSLERKIRQKPKYDKV